MDQASRASSNLDFLTTMLPFYAHVCVSHKHLLKCETLSSREERLSLYRCDWQALTW